MIPGLWGQFWKQYSRAFKRQVVLPEIRAGHLGTVRTMRCEAVLPDVSYRPREEFLALLVQGRAALDTRAPDTAYFKTKERVHSTETAWRCVWRYWDLYHDILRNGFRQDPARPHSFPWMLAHRTHRPIRLDGTHRVSILRYLHVPTVQVVFVTTNQVRKYCPWPEGHEAMRAAWDALFEEPL